MNTSQQEIAVRAYELWREGGSQNGHHEEHWRQAERELAPVDVILASAGDNKIALIKEVRSLTGLDLVSARALVETAPQTLMRGAKRVEAEKIRQRLATVGAKIEVAVPQVLVRDEHVQVLHGFDTVENAKAYLTSRLFTDGVVAGLKPLPKADPEMRIYAVP